LIDSNEITDGRIAYGNSGAGLQSVCGNLWHRSVLLGSSGAVYIEDNIFIGIGGTTFNFLDSNRGSRYVFR
jgi:hypothetical protein